jgi:transposase
MPRALSLDLRVRVLAAVARGLSHRQAGERFGVSPRASAGGGRSSGSGAKHAPGRWAETGDLGGSRRTKTRSSFSLKRRRTSRLRSCAKGSRTKA